MIWLNQVVQGVLLGGYYALVACGLSFLYGVMKIINLAHGSLTVLAAFALLELCERFGLSPFVAVLPVIVLMAAIGWLLQRSVLERTARGGVLVPILATFGLSIMVDNLLFQYFGADTKSLAPFVDELATASWQLSDDISIGVLDVLVFGTAVVLLGGLHLMLRRTPLGRAIRATAQDPDTAGLVGVDARRVAAIAASIAMATVALAGLALGLRATFTPYAGAPQLLAGFEAAVIGGAGSLWGTLLGGIVLGVAQNLGAQIDGQGFLVAGHGVFLAVLVVRTWRGGGWSRLLRPRVA